MNNESEPNYGEKLVMKLILVFFAIIAFINIVLVKWIGDYLGNTLNYLTFVFLCILSFTKIKKHKKNNPQEYKDRKEESKLNDRFMQMSLVEKKEILK